KEWYEAAARTVAGEPTKTKRRPRRRRGHKKRAPGTPPPPRRELAPPGVHSGEALLEHYLGTELVEEKADAESTLANYLGNNLFRMDYANLRRRGYQIGSGAMESLHRVASQARIKLPGARWGAETSASIFALRMLQLVGRWDAFWAQSDLPYRLVDALTAPRAGGA